jgi:RND family efflux transporter MFP subunit
MGSLKHAFKFAYRHKGSLILGMILIMSSLSIIRSLRAPADTVARSSDVERAKRTEGEPPGQQTDRNLNAQVEDPTLGGVAANGVIEPQGDEILLASEVPGVIAEIKVKEGQSVKKGDVLILFRSDIEQAQTYAAEADLKSIRARADLAKSVLERTKKLSRDKVATAEELDRAEKSLAIESAQVLAADARLRQAKSTLERLTITAPIDGEILKIHFNPGEYYNPASGQALLVMGDVQHLRIRIELDERDLARVKVGSQGHFIADAYGSKKFPFTLSDLGRRMGGKELKSDDPRERTDTRVLNIFGMVEGGDARQLIPGLRVTAFLPSENQDFRATH